MAWVAVIGAVGTVGGAMLGSKKGATDQTQSNAKSMDPRVEKMYFGEDGKGGLLGDLNQWYGANKSGINPDMQAGLDHMKSVYQSPLATQGYERMANTGYDLMGRGVAENPFVSGNMPNFGRLQNNQQAQFQMPQMPQFTRAGQQVNISGNVMGGLPPGYDNHQSTPGAYDPTSMDDFNSRNNVQAPQVAPAAQTSNLGLSEKPTLSLSNNWAAPPAPAPVAPVAPAPAQQNTITDQDQFRKMYEEEMKRQQAAWWADMSNNPTAGFGA